MRLGWPLAIIGCVVAIVLREYWLLAIYIGFSALVPWLCKQTNKESRAVFATDEGKKIIEIFEANEPLFAAVYYSDYASIVSLSGYSYGNFWANSAVNYEEYGRYYDYYHELRELLKLAYVTTGLAIDEPAVVQSLLYEARQLRERRLRELLEQRGLNQEEYRKAEEELGQLEALSQTNAG